MKLERLHIQGVRCLTDTELIMTEGINMLVGANGTGKTAVLEAIHLLSHGRSFRRHARDALVQKGKKTLTVFSQWQDQNGHHTHLGLGRNNQHWEARINGEWVKLNVLLRQCAVVCFEPGSHALIGGQAEERRQYLNWGLFHAETTFIEHWRRYQRALRQRNHLLRSEHAIHSPLYLPWEAEMGRLARYIDDWRQHYIKRLLPYLRTQAHALIPELGAVTCHYRRGWAEDQDLDVQLAKQRSVDARCGHTRIGAHRADWSISFEQACAPELLSRGQEKLTALSCLLAQAALHANLCGQWPLICLDDFASELDQKHQQAVLDLLQQSDAQIVLTGTELPTGIHALPVRMFNLEQGRVQLNESTCQTLL